MVEEEEEITSRENMTGLTGEMPYSTSCYFLVIILIREKSKLFLRLRQIPRLPIS